MQWILLLFPTCPRGFTSFVPSANLRNSLALTNERTDESTTKDERAGENPVNPGIRGSNYFLGSPTRNSQLKTIRSIAGSPGYQNFDDSFYLSSGSPSSEPFSLFRLLTFSSAVERRDQGPPLPFHAQEQSREEQFQGEHAAKGLTTILSQQSSEALPVFFSSLSPTIPFSPPLNTAIAGRNVSRSASLKLTFVFVFRGEAAWLRFVSFRWIRSESEAAGEFF